jgi:hypothetical protein
MDGEGSSTLKYVGIGCAVVTLLGLCGIGSCITCAGAGVGGIMMAVEAPAEASHGFLRDLRSGNTAGAYARTSAAFQATHPEADFAARVAAVPALTTASDATLPNRNVRGATATMSGTLDGPSGPVGHVTIELSSMGEAWVIDSVTVDGTPL